MNTTMTIAQFYSIVAKQRVLENEENTYIISRERRKKRPNRPTFIGAKKQGKAGHKPK